MAVVLAEVHKIKKKRKLCLTLSRTMTVQRQAELAGLGKTDVDPREAVLVRYNGTVVRYVNNWI
jgi:hypothetical protein